MNTKKWIIIYLTVGVASFILFYFRIINFDNIIELTSESDKFIPELNKQHIKEFGFIYVGSSKCAYSNNHQIYDAVKEIKYNLSKIAKDNKVGFHAIGLAAELNPKQGIQHLNNFGNFNEIISGSGWNNVGVFKYLQRFSQDYATPSILVTERIYSDSTFRYLESEKLLYSLSGQYRILQLQRNGLELVE